MNGQYRIGDTVMKNWVIKKKLGEGSFGKVWRIERQEFGEVYHAALKIITVPQSEAEIQAALEEGMSPDEAEQYFYSMVEDIVREFALMAKLKGTAYVVSYEDHEVVRHSQGLGWDILIRMEELTGLLPYAYAHPFTRRDVIQLGIHMCKGLELCQKYNIIHRDIKPENIFVSENGDFKLGDFGIARTVEKTMSGLSKKGTYNYMAPEVYKGLKYGFSVDIYSLGIVMYRLLNKNRVPFLPPAPQKLTYASREQALARRMSGDPIPEPIYGQGRLGEIVMKATAYDPKDRYSSPGQMRQELEAILYDEQDAAVIYPEGDEITLKENIYATMERNRFQKQMTEEAIGEEEDEDQTVSAFEDRRPQKTEKPVQEESAEPKKSGGKGGLIAAVAVIAVVAIGAGVMLMGGGGDEGESDPNQDIDYQEQMQSLQDMSNRPKYGLLYDEAEDLFERDPEAAMAKMVEALALFPEDTGAQTDYAYALYRCGYYADCVNYIEKDLSLGRDFETDKYTSLMEILGAAYYEMDDYAQAAVAFKSSAMGGDMTEGAMRDYAVCLARLGSAAEAKDVLAQMRSQGANSDVTRYVEGEVTYAAGEADDYAEAEKIFLEILEEGEDRSIQVRAFKSLTQLYRDCYNAVQYGTFAQSPIEDVNAKLYRLLRGGIEEYSLTYDSSLYEMLGTAAYNAYVEGKNAGQPQDQYDEYGKTAIDAFQKVLELGMKKDYIYTNLYTVYYSMDNYTEAGGILDEMEASYPQNYIPHALRGILTIVQENQKAEGERDYSQALAEYEKAGQKIKSSDDAVYYQQLGSYIEQLQDGGWLD